MRSAARVFVLGVLATAMLAGCGGSPPDSADASLAGQGRQTARFTMAELDAAGDAFPIGSGMIDADAEVSRRAGGEEAGIPLHQRDPGS